MSDTTDSTAAASEPNHGAQDGATGSGYDGGAGGTPDAGALAAGGDAWEARARDWQGKHDRLAARLNQLEGQLAQSDAGNGVGEPDAEGIFEFDPDAYARSIEERFAHRIEMREAANALREEFGYADGDLFKRAHEFQDVDALRAALQTSHGRVAGEVERAVAEREASLRAEMSQKYGLRFETPVDGGQAPSADPSIDQIRAMSIHEQIQFEQANPGVIDRVLRQASLTV